MAKGGATIGLQVTSFSGTADAFLDQVQRAEGDDDLAGLSGSRGTVTTDAGLVGVAQSSTSTSGDELEAAFKLHTGSAQAITAAPALVIDVRTAPGQFEQYQDVVMAMVRSITPAVNR